MTHEEAAPVVFKLMDRYLDGRTSFQAQDFTAMVNSLSVEEYVEHREAVAAFRLER